MSGHAIEARVYAEDPSNDFLPVTGRIHEFSFDGTVRVDAGVAAGSNVSVFYDPMLAKAIAFGADRTAAIRTLAGALRSARIHAETTNRGLLVRILEDPEFLAGDFDTHFLQRDRFEQMTAPLATPKDEAEAARAVALADQAVQRASAAVLTTLPSGWRNLPSGAQRRSYSGAHGDYEVEYSIQGDQATFVDDSAVHVLTCRPEVVEYETAEGSLRFEVTRYDELRFVDTAAVPVRLEALPRFPSSLKEESAGSLHSPMPGKVIRVNKTEGDTVVEGEVLMVLEAMKMEHTIKAPRDGTVVSLAYREGDQVDAGSVLAVVDPVDDGE
jgi:propionyl-CoA carboxylase alpha chain